MENQNIQYRKLRNPSRARTGKYSSSLLGKQTNHQRIKQQKQKNKLCTHTILSRNLIEYQHLLKNPLLHLQEVDWVSKLRQPIRISQCKMDDVDIFLPIVFTKTTQNWNNYKSNKMNKLKSYNSADFYQVVSRKQCDKHLQEGTLNYMTNLRDYPQDKTLTKQQSQSKNKLVKQVFINVPFKQKNQYPKFITKQSIKKMRINKQKDVQSAFDGCQNYPLFTQKIIKQQNFGIYHIFTMGSQKIDLPTLSWQMGLRS